MEAIWKAAQRERGISIMKLSIIVPVYNLENYVSGTLDSLLSIRFSYDYEIIVVNDGSTDGTEAIVAGYQEKTEKIRLFTIENGGVSHARNVGIRHAQGQYITFMDGDDTVDPDFYEKAVSELDAGGYDFVQGNFRVVNGERVHDKVFVDRDTELLDRKQMLEQFLVPGRSAIHRNVWGKVFRQDVARKVTFDTSVYHGEDRKYVFDVLCGCDRIKLLKDMSCNYIQRDSSVCHTLTYDGERQLYEVMTYYVQKIPYPELIPIFDTERVNWLLGQYYAAKKAGHPRAAGLRRELRALPCRKMWPYMNRTMRKRVLLHMFAAPLYDLYIVHLKKETDA